MSKATLTFNLDDPCDRENFELTLRARELEMALHEVREKIFRPARKHGYEDLKLNKLFEDCSPDFIYELETKFNEILIENGLEKLNI